MVIVKRDAYERELVQIITKKEKRLYGQRGTHSDGVDVLFFIGETNQNWAYSIRCEVKTTVDTVRYFNKKLQEQYNNYRNTLRNYRVITFYCFRTLTKKKVIEQKNKRGEVLNTIAFREGFPEDKWRIFSVDEIPLNNRGTPYLDFFHEDGKTIEQFLRLFEKLMD
jgi:hypothetical protein